LLALPVQREDLLSQLATQRGLTCKPTCTPACLHWIQASVDQKFPLIAVSEILLFQSGDTGSRVPAMRDKTLIGKPARELVTQSNPAGLGQTHRLALVTAEAIDGVPARPARTPTRAHQRNYRQAEALP
jgi:DNA-binding LytR/AlgR family response regulator